MKPGAPIHRFIPHAAAASAVAAGALALAGLAAWCLGRWQLVALGGAFLPMAPGAALPMLVLSIAAFLRTRPSLNRAARALETACILLVLGWIALVWLRLRLGLSLPAEDWLCLATGTAGGIPADRLSSLTAGCFVLGAAAQLCGHVPGLRERLLRSLGGWLALAVLAVSSLVVAGYLSGSSLLYGSSTLPMAPLTAVAFVLLNSGVLLGAGSHAWPLCMFLRERTPERPSGEHSLEWPLLLLLLLVAAGITVVSERYLNHRQADARAAAWAELGAIADLKAQQIANWRKERLVDANWIRATPYAARRALDALARPDSPPTRKMFTGWIDPLLAGGNYERVLLLDDKLNVQLVYPEIGSRTLCKEARVAAEQALRTRDVAIADLHRAPDDSPIHLSFMVPLVVRREDTNDNVPAAGLDFSPSDRSAAVLILQVDARQFLFPLIQKWPTPSPTAETLLVRREGNEVVFLNELRHQRGTALTLRRALDQAQLPAAMGVRGDTRVQAGVDYRGVAVVAATRAVPGTPWLVVAKVDKAELYAPVREETLKVAGVLLALLLAAALGVTLLWRRRNEHFLRAQLVAEQERRVLAERFEHFMKHASEIVLLSDAQGRILEANHRAVETYGWTLAELQRLTLLDLRPADLRADSSRQTEPLLRGEPASFETLHRRKDGGTFPAEVSASAIEISGVGFRLDIIRDITQRKVQEAEIARLNRLYATLSQINQTILRLDSREAMFQAICRIMARHGGYKVAWIGWLDRKTQAVVPVARAGEDEGYVDKIKVCVDDRPEGGGPVGRCIREGNASVFNDFINDPRAMPWHEAALAHGLRSAVAIPVRYQGEVCGALAVYTDQPNVFQDKEVALLEEAALDLSFALDHLEVEVQRRRAQEALLASEIRYRRLFESAKDGILILDAETGVIVDVNPFLAQFLRLPREAFLGKKVWELGFFENIVANRADFVEFQAEEYNRCGDRLLETADGGQVEVEVVSIVYLVDHRKLVQCNLRDITERKLAEVALQQSEERFRRAVVQAPIPILLHAEDGVILQASDSWCEISGYSREELTSIGEWTERAYGERKTLVQADIDALYRLNHSKYEGDYTIRTKSGGTRIWEFSSAPLGRLPDGRRLVISTAMDVTERRRAEQERLAMAAQLRHQQKLESIGTLASGVAHEINNPINGVMNYAQLIQDRLPANSPLTEFTREILNETQRVATIVRNLLTFSRNEKQNHSLARVVDIVEGTLSLIRTVIRHDQITLDVDLQKDLPDLHCRGQQIQQVLMNLVTNARDALNQRYPGHDPDKVLNLSATLVEKEGRRWIRVTVEDHGTGITPEVRERMFDPFFTTKPRNVGTGMGLSISHGIVKEHHGALTVESEPGRFTRMHLDLPVEHGWKV